MVIPAADMAAPGQAQYLIQTERSQACCTQFVHYTPTYVVAARRNPRCALHLGRVAWMQVFFARAGQVD